MTTGQWLGVVLFLAPIVVALAWAVREVGVKDALLTALIAGAIIGWGLLVAWLLAGGAS